MSETSRFGVGSAISIAAGLVFILVLVASQAPSSRAVACAAPSLVSMDEAAQAMQQAGEAIKTHGQEMLDEGKRNGNADLTALGEQWLRDGNAIVTGGDWMSEDPTAPGNLHASRSDLTAQGSWAKLTRRVQAMVHDPRGASSTDLEALRSDGLAMQAEGQNMNAQGQLMDKNIDLMTATHKLGAGELNYLHGTAARMQQAGNGLAANGQQMINYVDQLRRSLGYRD